jgi:hypothetical protein
MAAKHRLGGMALANGVLVHGPRHWACAVRTSEGKVAVASGEKPLRAAGISNDLLRGPARVLEIFALFPAIRRSLPEAKLPFQRPRVALAMLGTALASKAVRESRLRPGLQEALVAVMALAPAALALRGSSLAEYHGAEHISIGTYEHGEPRPREHERCGSHVVGPLVVTSAAGARSPGSRPRTSVRSRGRRPRSAPSRARRASSRGCRTTRATRSRGRSLVPATSSSIGS